MTRLLLIGLAGALGTCTRYLVGLGAARLLGTGFPFGTLLVNLAGCFLIAAITYTALNTDLISPTARLTLTTGFMGGLTTYSSFNLETTQLLQGRAWQTAALNFSATVLGCFVAGLLGFAAARRVLGP
jgi:CrcB protein